MRSSAVLFFSILTLLFACKEDESFFFYPVVELAINGVDSIAISDSIIFVTEKESTTNEIQIFSKPADAQIYFSVDGRRFETAYELTFTIAKEDSIFQFYLTREGFKRSDLYTIIFSEHPAQFLNQIHSYPIPVDSLYHIQMIDKTRGRVGIELLNISGTWVQPPHDYLKKADTLIVSQDLYDLDAGMYLAIIRFGSNAEIINVVKQ